MPSALGTIRNNRRLFVRPSLQLAALLKAEVRHELPQIVGAAIQQDWDVKDLTERWGKRFGRFVIVGALVLFGLNLTVKANWDEVFQARRPICAHAALDGHGEKVCLAPRYPHADRVR